MTTKNGYFSYCPDNGFELHDTMEAAEERARESIKGWLDGAWAEEVTEVCCGKLAGKATQTDRVERPETLDEDGCDEEGNYWGDYEYRCNYALRPV